MLDSYTVLGLSRRATSDEIKAAYRALAKRYHPDANAGDAEGEWRTKEINRAYAILGDAEARAAYDRELARRRAAARRGFWLSAATGAATFIVMVSSVWVVAMWRQNASILQLQNSEPAVLVGVAPKPPAEIVAYRRPAGLGDRDGRDAPSETVIASVPELFGEPPSSIAPVMPSSPRDDRETWGDRDGRDAPSQVVIASVPELFGEPPSSIARVTPSSPRDDRKTWAAASPAPPAAPPPPEKIPSVQPSDLAHLPQGQGVPAPAERTPPRTELAKAAPLEEVATKQPIPALAVAPKPRQKSIPRDADRKTVAGGRAAKKSGRQINVTDQPGNTQPSPQGMQREPRVVSKTATALRWPSADEPFVHVGGRSR